MARYRKALVPLVMAGLVAMAGFDLGLDYVLTFIMETEQ